MAESLQRLANDQSHASEALIRIDERLKTINARGCSTGMTVMEELRESTDKKISAVHKRVDSHRYLTYIMGAMATIGGAIAGIFTRP